eukprot:GHVR01071249.1.p2 GENE.GHVR01071249.1~~GHVR01071249.1.p2  ORF type:complete len:114 (-),score=17.47 GHVR01071249.1:477-818(-)
MICITIRRLMNKVVWNRTKKGKDKDNNTIKSSSKSESGSDYRSDGVQDEFNRNRHAHVSVNDKDINNGHNVLNEQDKDNINTGNTTHYDCKDGNVDHEQPTHPQREYNTIYRL